MGGLSGLSGLRGLSGLTAKQVIASGFDPDAQTFFTAANITNPTQQAAVNNLVIAFKADGSWASRQAIYPFVGGTASQHSFNLKDPSQFQITWIGTVTHDANGITGDGTTGYGNTNYNPSVSGTLGSASLSLYMRTDRAASATIRSLGSGSGSNFYSIATFFTAGVFRPIIGSTSLLPSGAVTNSQGLFRADRQDATNILGYRNGVEVLNAPQNQGGLANIACFIAAQNSSGSPTGRSTDNIAFASIGTYFAANDYAAIQAFQTALGRQV